MLQYSATGAGEHAVKIYALDSEVT